MIRINEFDYQIVKENDLAVMLKTDSFFEVWIKLKQWDKKSKYQFQFPTDEDFGVWAWATFSIQRAETIFQEITQETRKVTPMVEDKEIVDSMRKKHRNQAKFVA